MSAILGLNGVFSGNLLISAIETLKHKGENSSDIFLLSDEKIIFNNNIVIASQKEDEVNDIHDFDYFNNNFNIGLAHTYNSIANEIDDNKFDYINYDYNSNKDTCSYKISKLSNSLKDQQHDIVNRQLIKYNNLVLVFNGEIYNLDEAKDFLKSQNCNLDEVKDFLKSQNCNLDEVKDFLKSQNVYNNGEILIRIIDYFSFKNNNHFLEAIKKTIGIIDGDYTFAVFNGENLAICRDSMGVKPLYYGKRENSYFDGNSFEVFASEKKVLWKMGINDNNIKTLKPGYILYNWEEIAPNSFPWKLSHEYKSKIATMHYNKIKKCLKDLIIESTYKRVNNLDEVGLIFSGGVDSTILAVLLKNLSNKTGLKLNLYSVGNENSQDLHFSEKIANDLELPLKTQIITEKVVKNNLKQILKAIEEFNIMKIGVGMVFYLATKLAKKDGINVVLAGQGADELFAGYNRYLSTYKNGGYVAIDQELSHDIENNYHVNLQRDDAVSMANGVELRVPFLDEKLAKFSLAIPSEYKIYSSTDKLRKHILRDLAIDLGVPEYVAMRKKKAAQYGSGIDKILRKKVLKNFDSEKFMVNIVDNSY